MISDSAHKNRNELFLFKKHNVLLTNFENAATIVKIFFSETPQ